ncbi:MAG: DUF1062 domain-containing protein [Lachnospiraceae bacterium]|nr:DUF1062 domain-containing protein [Lachnospiraceae bacterium]
MSYLRKIEYEIVLKDSFCLIRNCPKCGRKAHYINTKKFRINANGNILDIWLIYQCMECKHTLNLAIYERKKVSSITKEEYQCFLDNDEQLAEMYGKNMQLFRTNKADIDFDRLHYGVLKLHETVESSGLGEQFIITVKNPYQMKIHSEKQIAMVLGLSRNQVKSLLEKGEIELVMELPQSISFSISHCLFSMIP